VSVTLVAEGAKWAISLTFYSLLPSASRTHHQLRGRDVALFAAPALVYFINNNLVFVILAYVNTTTFQILSALKTVFTGILFRLILKRILSDVQSVGILLLACGVRVHTQPNTQLHHHAATLSLPTAIAASPLLRSPRDAAAV
jgi:drug/metabolite transporter (DMT)-like permease